MASFLKNIWKSLTGSQSSVDDMPKYTFPETIEEFGYVFNDKGQLVKKNDMTGRFEYDVKEDDRNYNQQHYDALGEVITEYLYGLIEQDLKLERAYVPNDGKKEEPLSFIFKSPDALTSDKLMVLIHGAGVVRAGQWSRKLIINEDIDTGSQFPYIRRAMADGYGIIVFNTNLNQAVVNGKMKDIRENSSPEKHGLYVWKHFVSAAKAKNIVVVAHSYGGVVLCNILEKYIQDFQERVFSVVFTDSVHGADRTLWSKQVKEFLKQRAVNFASTYVPINLIMLSSNPDDVMSVSAGTKEHERTSNACIDSAFKFIRDNYESWSKGRSMAPRPDFMPLPEDLSMYSPAKDWERRADEESKRKEQEELKKKSGEQQRLSEEQSTLPEKQKQQQQQLQESNTENEPAAANPEEAATAVEMKTNEVEVAEEAEHYLEEDKQAPQKHEALEKSEAPEKSEASEKCEAPEKKEAQEKIKAPEKSEAPQNNEAHKNSRPDAIVKSQQTGQEDVDKPEEDVMDKPDKNMEKPDKEPSTEKLYGEKTIHQTMAVDSNDAGLTTADEAKVGGCVPIDSDDTRANARESEEEKDKPSPDVPDRSKPEAAPCVGKGEPEGVGIEQTDIIEKQEERERKNDELTTEL